MATMNPVYTSFDSVISHNANWFSRSNMRFFGTRISAASVEIMPGGYVVWFVTSERRTHADARRYSVRRASFSVVEGQDGWYEGTIDTVGAFHSHPTRAAALAAMRAAIAAELAPAQVAA